MNPTPCRRPRSRRGWPNALHHLFALLVACTVLPQAWALDPDKRLHQYVADAWSLEHGLPQITVADITQDTDGYLWVATHAGLARFDGNRFTSYLLQDHPELQGAMINAVAGDAHGRVWVGSYKGLSVIEDGRLSKVGVAPDVAGAEDLILEINAISVQGDIVDVATQAGAFHVRDGVLHPHPGLVDTPTHSIWREGPDLWLGGAGGAWLLNGGVRQWYPLSDVAGAPPLTRIFRDSHGTLWGGSLRGLFRQEGEGWVAHDEADTRLRDPVGDIVEDRDGNLWVSTTDHLLRLREGRVVEAAGAGHASVPRQVRSVFEDREGNLWLGAQADGLVRLWNGWTFRHSTPEGLHEPVLWSVAPTDDGRILLGTADGLAVMQHGSISTVLPGASLPHPHAYTLLAEGDTVWIGTRNGAARLVDGRVETPPEFAALEGLQVNGFVRDARNRLWIGTTGGLFRLDADGLQQFGRPSGLHDPRVRVIVDEGADGLLLGTQSGLFRFNEGRATRLGEAEGLPPNVDITAMLRLRDGGLVVGTISERLFHFDGQRWQDVSTSGELPDNAAFFMAEDSHGWLWVAGIRGIYRLKSADLVRFRQDPEVGLPSEMLLNERGIYRGGQKGYCCNGAGNAKGMIADDRLWLPSRDGLVSIAAGDVHHNPIAAEPLVERVIHRGTVHGVADGQDLGTLEGRPRDVAFEFTTTSLQQPDSVEIRYRLRGYDEAWTSLPDISRRNVSYTNLPPGSYSFEVRAANNSGLWSDHTAHVDFDIRPRFHETAWFYLLIVLVGAAAGAGISRLRTRLLRVRQRELEGLIRKRTEDLEAANQQLAIASQTDALTGLHNRRYLRDQLPRDMAFYNRELAARGQAMVLALIDIDHFKPVNDQHGHLAGDEVLCEFASRLLEQVRQGDYVVRWGGEEFLLVMRPMPHEQIERCIERIRQAIASTPFTLGNGTRLELTCSIGFATFPFGTAALHDATWERLVDLADRALYEVKRGGRNGWATFRLGPAHHLMTLQEVISQPTGRLLQARVLELVGSPGLRPVSSGADS